MMQRRQTVTAVLAMPFVPRLNAQQADLVLGQVIVTTGPSGVTGGALVSGTQAYIDHINASGGVRGRKLRLITRDDSSDPSKTVTAVQSLLEEERVSALINLGGTAQVDALQKAQVLEKYKSALVGPFAASAAIRNSGSRYIFYVRPSIREEASTIVRQLFNQSFSRIGIIHSANSLGTEAMELCEAALAARGLKPSLKVAVDLGADGHLSATQQAIASNAQALALFLPARISNAFVSSYRKALGSARLFASSSTSAEVMVQTLGPELSRGVMVLQAVPNPSQRNWSIVREYYRIMQQHAALGWKPSSFSMEGLLNARVLVEGLKRARDPSKPEEVFKALETVNKLDIGGMVVDFSGGRRTGTLFTDVGIIRSDGKLVG
jgi:branched-chain amino acid transport system substrate-binding protein